MHTSQTLSLLALAGSALAAPGGWDNWSGNYFGGNRGGEQAQPPSATQTDVAVVTAYTTVTWGGNFGGKPTATAEASQPAATYAAAPPSAPAPSASAPVSSNDGSYMSIVSEWRSKMGMSDLSHDSTLEANALKTAQDGNGNMVHELNPGTMGQVLAPGSSGEFEKVFVGGWLCERPDLPGLDGICSSMSQGWAYNGETGHADILVSNAYSKIGCAEATGIWACDLA